METKPKPTDMMRYDNNGLEATSNDQRTLKQRHATVNPGRQQHCAIARERDPDNRQEAHGFPTPTEGGPGTAPATLMKPAGKAGRNRDSTPAMTRDRHTTQTDHTRYHHPPQQIPPTPAQRTIPLRTYLYPVQVLYFYHMSEEKTSHSRIPIPGHLTSQETAS